MERIPDFAPWNLYGTDDCHPYTFLKIHGNHVVIKKEKGKPEGRDHLNGIEGFWSYAKHWLHHYRGVPRKRFYRYLQEIEWRFNHRDEDLVILPRRLLTQRVVKEQNLVQACWPISFYNRYIGKATMGSLFRDLSPEKLRDAVRVLHRQEMVTL